MKLFSLLPQRCSVCGQAASEELCRPCQARRERRSSLGSGQCRVCAAPLLGEAELCADCVSRDGPFTALDGLYGYQEPGAELIRLYKFGGASVLARSWARAAAGRLIPPGPLVPIPTFRRRLWRRGWDPVGFWTAALARELALPVWRILSRKPTPAQKSLGREERTENARAAYRLRRRHVSSDVAWLIDDIVTTGATVEACARLLRDAGVKEVRVFCLGLH